MSHLSVVPHVSSASQQHRTIRFLSGPTPVYLIFLGLTLFFALLFARLIPGVGNNWDWVFPYFRSDLPEIYLKDVSQWVSVGFGAPQSYMPSHLFSLIILPLTLLPIQPEVILYLLIVLIFSAGSTVSYVGLRTVIPRWAALITCLAVMVNPPIFYKLLSGHLVYIFSYVAFIALMLFLVGKYKPTLKCALLLGFLLALTAVQVQFLVFSFIVTAFYFFYYKKHFKLGYLLVALLVFTLIHIFWLSNFFLGFSGFKSVGDLASLNTFPQLERTGFVNVFRMTFTDATFINRFFTPPYQILTIAATLIGVALLALNKTWSARSRMFVSVWLFFVLLSSGIYRIFPIPLIKGVYPLLREAGHAAPLVVLSFLATLVSIVQEGKGRLFLLSSVAGLVLMASIPIFFSSLPIINFAQSREALSSFKNYSELDKETYRVLTYPFFNQNRFVDQPQTSRLGTPMSNSGWDSFIVFSGLEYVDNSVSRNGVQQELLETYNLSILRPYNVKYIYDLSSVYRSEAKHFLPPEDEILDILRRNNDPRFMEKLISANPGQLTKVSEGIYRVEDYSTRLTGFEGSFQRLTDTEYIIEVVGIRDSAVLTFLTSYHPGWKLIIEPYAPLECSRRPVTPPRRVSECEGANKLVSGNELTSFGSPTIGTHLPTQEKMNYWKVDGVEVTELPANLYRENEDGTLNIRLRLVYQPNTAHLIALALSYVTIISVLSLLFIRVTKPNA